MVVMKNVYTISDNVISPLGFSTQTNFHSMLEGRSGIAKTETNMEYVPTIFASAIADETIENHWNALPHLSPYTRFEKLAILSIAEALLHTDIQADSPDTILILSTTKGNIELIDPDSTPHFSPDRVHLWRSAQEIARYFGNPNEPFVISHACISGVSALITAKRYLEDGVYKHAIVCGADVLSRFIIAGFNSLKALSFQPCKPYDAEHEGLNLGEGAATIILTTEQERATGSKIKVISGCTSNDANHISGPSRTGEGLYRAIMKTITPEHTASIGFINAHGTATVFNDDMEAVAIMRAGLQDVLTCGFKGYIGHTLGAAGVMETALSIAALKNQRLPGTWGFNSSQNTNKITVKKENTTLTKTTFLKTASGFGGCNAAILIGVEE